jgi:endogenous inhibitor of DNA gyrase (YacG/DUF329 family)
MVSPLSGTRTLGYCPKCGVKEMTFIDGAPFCCNRCKWDLRNVNDQVDLLVAIMTEAISQSWNERDENG